MKNRIRILARVPRDAVETEEVIGMRCKDSVTFDAHDPDYNWYKENVPCMKGCPAETRIPEYLNAISAGNYEECYKINRTDNIFPNTLGRVCAHPCEKKCRHGFSGMGDSISICWSKRTGGDFKKKVPPVEAQNSPTGKKVAVVGAGPCGLSVANDLALLGHAVTVFDGLPVAGGMMSTGIPVFRLPRHHIQEEINDIERLGVEVKLNHKIGKDITIKQLKDKYDALAITTGCMNPMVMNIPGENLKGVIPGLDFMMDVNLGKLTEIAGTVVVVGGGFTAMDCSRAALRLGANKVVVIYRRTKNELLVDDRELREASKEGVEFYFLVSPMEAISNGENKLVKLKCVKNKLGDPGPDGRRKAIPVEGSEFFIETDYLIPAVSQSPDSSFLTGMPNINLLNGKIKIDEKTFMTSEKGVFAAGDCVTGPKNLIAAIGHGRRAAASIDLYLMKRNRIKERVAKTTYPQRGMRSVYQWKINNQDIYDVIPVREIASLGKEDRASQEKEVDLGYSKEIGIEQADRCYLCNHNIHIREVDCILCANCVDVCPYDCIKIAKATHVNVLSQDKNEAAGKKSDLFYMLIDEEKCIRCGLCIDVCPTSCLTMDKISFSREYEP